MEYIQQVYGEGWVASTPVTDDGSTKPVDLAAPADNPTFVDVLVNQLATRADGEVAAWITRIREQVMAATSWSDLEGRLAELLTTLPLIQIGEAIAGASAAAERAGRVDVQVESEGA